MDIDVRNALGRGKLRTQSLLQVRRQSMGHLERGCGVYFQVEVDPYSTFRPVGRNVVNGVMPARSYGHYSFHHPFILRDGDGVDENVRVRNDGTHRVLDVTRDRVTLLEGQISWNRDSQIDKDLIANLAHTRTQHVHNTP